MKAIHQHIPYQVLSWKCKVFNKFRRQVGGGCRVDPTCWIFNPQHFTSSAPVGLITHNTGFLGHKNSVFSIKMHKTLQFYLKFRKFSLGGGSPPLHSLPPCVLWPLDLRAVYVQLALWIKYTYVANSVKLIIIKDLELLSNNVQCKQNSPAMHNHVKLVIMLCNNNECSSEQQFIMAQALQLLKLQQSTTLIIRSCTLNNHKKFQKTLHAICSVAYIGHRCDIALIPARPIWYRRRCTRYVHMQNIRGRMQNTVLAATSKLKSSYVDVVSMSVCITTS